MKIHKERIKHLIKLKSLRQKDVAKAIGVTTQDWNNWMFRGVFPHYNKLQELAQILDVPTDELMTEPLFSEPNPKYQGGNQVLMENAIPFFDLESVSALKLLSGKHTDLPPGDYTYIPGIVADFIIPYYGKEMAPSISSGDLIALRKVVDFSFFNFGSPYLLVTKEQVMVRYVKAANKKGFINLCASTEAFDTIELPVKKLTAVYLIASTIKRELI